MCWLLIDSLLIGMNHVLVANLYFGNQYVPCVGSQWIFHHTVSILYWLLIDNSIISSNLCWLLVDILPIDINRLLVADEYFVYRYLPCIVNI
jgi:hypothetical protein